MPLYEFKCLDCGNLFELLIMKSEHKVRCPACESESVERVLSLFAVSSESSRQANTAKAYAYNNKLNAKHEPDKQRIQIDHKHQH